MRIYISFDTESVLVTNGMLRRDIVVFGRQFLIDAMNDNPEEYKAFDNFEFLNRLCWAMASGWVEFLENIQHKLWLLDDKALDHGDSLNWCVDEFKPIFQASQQTFRRNVYSLNCSVYTTEVMEILDERLESEFRDMLATLEGELENTFDRAWRMFRT